MLKENGYGYGYAARYEDEDYDSRTKTFENLRMIGYSKSEAWDEISDMFFADDED